jgi:hypothetical protein
MRGLTMAMVPETPICIHLTVAAKQPLARVSEMQVRCPGTPLDDTKAPIF